jgi:glycosyltransferase involved in cell wall biosynthesis
MKPQVLLITGIYPPQVGGPAIFTSRFSSWLFEKNYEVKVITYSTDKAVSDENVCSVSLNNNRMASFSKFILEILKNSNSKTLVLSNGAFIETFFACLISRRKYILKIPGDHVWELSKNRGWTNKNIEEFQSEKLNFIQRTFRLLTNLSLKNAAFVISPSNQLAIFAKKWGVKNEKIKIIYNCVNPDQFNKIDMPKKNFDLITVCRLVPWKGLEELIECSIKLNLKLLIVGDGPLLNKLKSLASGWPSNISFMGTIENSKMPEILNSSKIFVLNSEFEATSYALIEAKMCGLPVLAKETDGSLTLIRKDIDGFIYSARNGIDLEGAISKLVDNKELIELFGFESRKDALHRFNETINFAKILDLMEISQLEI